jgi:hypothetical protein
MENRAELNIHQGPASIAKAELASNAETPEISPPMLDVHAPHEVLHTWKGFFIHIATIVVGLFIAVALEQSVEALNRHREVAALREGEVNAYAEVEYVQAHVDEMEVIKNRARYAVKSFNREFSSLPNGDPDFSNASSDDLHTYLGLLTTAYEAIEGYIHWLRIMIGAESAVFGGKINLDEIYASERKAGGGDSLKNFM